MTYEEAWSHYYVSRMGVIICEPCATSQPNVDDWSQCDEVDTAFIAHLPSCAYCHKVEADESQPIEWPTTTGTPDPTRNEDAASDAFARKNPGF